MRRKFNQNIMEDKNLKQYSDYQGKSRKEETKELEKNHKEWMKEHEVPRKEDTFKDPCYNSPLKWIVGIISIIALCVGIWYITTQKAMAAGEYSFGVEMDPCFSQDIQGKCAGYQPSKFHAHLGLDITEKIKISVDAKETYMDVVDAFHRMNIDRLAPTFDVSITHKF